MPRYFVIETRDRRHNVTRRIRCRDMDTAYSVAAQLRGRTVAHGDRGCPLPTTPVSIIEVEGDTRGHCQTWTGRVVACLSWPGRPTLREAMVAATDAQWMAIDPANTARGACIPMDRPKRWLFAALPDTRGA